MGIKVIKTDDYDAMGKEAAKLFAAVIKAKPNCVLGLATGSTPISTYKELIRMHKEEGLDFSKVTSFNLDEYVGLDGDHDQSYRYFMNDNLFNHINIDKSKTFVPSGTAKDVAKMCADYEAAMKAAGGVDIQLLGIGGNGHIAFNEPGSPLDSRTRQVDLTPETISDNARFFESIDDVPKTAVSMGLGTIMEAKKVVLVANKANKADAVKASVNGPVSTACPASVLQNHPDCVFVIEKEAAAKI